MFQSQHCPPSNGVYLLLSGTTVEVQEALVNPSGLARISKC